MTFATLRRRLRRLKDPAGFIRWIVYLFRQRRAAERQIRLHIDGRTGTAITPQRPRMTFPASAEELRKSDVFNAWWYYGAELLPGVTAKGMHAYDLPMLPRIMLRRCDPAGMSFLEMGPMEGLMPVVMKRRGASHVLAVDGIDGCAEKMEALKHYYGVDFEFKVVGLMYDLYQKLCGQAFEIVNCSGLLYHVFSPISILAGLRPLIKRNGLFVVSTGVIRDAGYFMEFNDAGRIQEETNTFWYLSVPLLDYLLRYLALAPIDCSFYWHSSIAQPHVRLRFDRPSGYASVVCRAVDTVLPAEDDRWMARSVEHSWEHRGLCDLETARAQPWSPVPYQGEPDRRAWREETDSLDLWKAAELLPEISVAAQLEDSHILMLDHRS
jgi:2-polyprenyl-3-methyl-5-hydroxy-6-metoxy-1,4-benzoquinol methylase